MRAHIALAVGLVLAVSLPSDGATTGESHYYHRKEEGWYWKEPVPIPIPPEPPKDTTPLPAPELQPHPPPPESPKPLSSAWLREQLPLYRDKAVENPTPENVRAYLYLQQYAMNLAERFAATAQSVVLADPMLDENERRPISSYGSYVSDEVAREGIEQVAKHVATMAGVWYFYRSDCPYCAAENPVLERLQQRIGLAILPIALDGLAMPEGHFAHFVPDRGHAAKLNVTATPTLYLLRPPNEFVLLTEGLLTDDALLERMVTVAHDAGWITDEEFQSTRPRKPPLLTVQAHDLPDEVLSNPGKLIEALRANDLEAGGTL